NSTVLHKSKKKKNKSTHLIGRRADPGHHRCARGELSECGQSAWPLGSAPCHLLLLRPASSRPALAVQWAPTTHPRGTDRRAARHRQTLTVSRILCHQSGGHHFSRSRRPLCRYPWPLGV